MSILMLQDINKYGLEAVPNSDEQPKITKKTVKAPEIKIEKPKPIDRLFQQVRSHRLQGVTEERTLKAKIADVKMNEATPIGRKFNRGTVFNPKLPDDIGKQTLFLYNFIHLYSSQIFRSCFEENERRTQESCRPQTRRKESQI